jgi:hypothetical protein
MINVLGTGGEAAGDSLGISRLEVVMPEGGRGRKTRNGNGRDEALYKYGTCEIVAFAWGGDDMERELGRR